MLHTKAFHNRPNDGHPLGIMIAESQALTGVEIKRAYVDKGYIGVQALARLPLRPEVPRLRPDQEGTAALGRYRTRHRPLEIRWPPWA